MSDPLTKDEIIGRLRDRAWREEEAKLQALHELKPLKEQREKLVLLFEQEGQRICNEGIPLTIEQADKLLREIAAVLGVSPAFVTCTEHF